MPTLCGPDGLQKNSIERSVPQAEGAWSVFGYFLLTKKYQCPALSGIFAFDLLVDVKDQHELGRRPRFFNH